MTVQLTIASSTTPAPQPDPGDPDGPADTVEGEFGPGAGTSTPPAGPGQPGEVGPTWITFGPGPAPTPAQPRPGGSAPGGTPDPTPQRGTGGRGAGSGAKGGGETDGSGSTGAGGGSSTSGPGGPAGTGSARPARRGLASRAPRPGRGPKSGPAADPTRRRSRIGRVIAAVRRARTYLTSPSPVRVPAGQLAGLPAPRPVRAPGRGPASGTPVLAWLTSRLGHWWRTGQGRASRLTDEDWRVIGILAVAAIVALGGQVDLGVPAAPLAAPAVAPAETGSTITSARVLELADSQVGTVEGRGGGTPYHRNYGIAADQPWCAVFVWDMFREAGASDLIGPKTAYTPTLANWFRQRGQWSGTPTVGALVFFNWPSDGRNRIQHVGIVASIGPTTIQTIEANTSSGVAGSQDNGGGVWRRTRPRNGSIVGYGLPAYSLNHQQP